LQTEIKNTTFASPKSTKANEPKDLAKKNGMLAQLVQSTCLTSRGSLVRTQYVPHKRVSDFKIWNPFFID
jgi:hypothetical protein